MLRLAGYEDYCGEAPSQEKECPDQKKTPGKQGFCKYGIGLL
jgi:hypothetical protein